MENLYNYGIFNSEYEVIKGMTERLVNDLRPLQVRLFGSRSKRTHRPDSDFDFIVVTRMEDGEEGRSYPRAVRPVVRCKVECDVVPCRIDDLKKARLNKITEFTDYFDESIVLYDSETGYQIDDKQFSRQTAETTR